MSGRDLLFLYGTLRHPELLASVAGRQITQKPAVLRGYAVRCVAGETFPMVCSEPGSSIAGAVVVLDADLRNRLDYYEGGYGYHLKAVAVEIGGESLPAEVYVPDPNQWQPGQAWSLDQWSADHGALAVASSHEAMSYFGTWSPAELARRFPMIRARADSRMRAKTATVPSKLRRGPGHDTVLEFSRSRKHAGFFALDELQLDHPAYAGGRSGRLTREVFIGTDAALVLPYDPTRDEVLLVEQFRAGPFRRDDPHPWVLEPVAGLIDPGETPEDAARREAMEEAGVTLTSLEPVAAGYPSPGATTEHYYCYVGICDLSGAGGNGGQSHEGEDIFSHILSRTDAMALIGSGEANVIPLVMLLLWLDANRTRLASVS